MFGCRGLYLKKHMKRLVFMRRHGACTTVFNVIALENVSHDPSNNKTFPMTP